jgi:23S rRNA G2445 N2-methylase RlmL
VFFVFINNNKAYLGIDFSGFDMSKRDYKIFNISGSLKGTIAYALVRLSGFKKSILNPLTRAGIMCIESALFASNFPVNYYKKKDFAFLKLKPLKKTDFDKFFNDIDNKIKKKLTQKIYCYNNDMRNVQAAKKNARVAGVQRLISFGKVDIEWLDTRFEKGKIQSIVSVINFSKDSNINDNKKFCEELFYQCEFILNKKGKMVILSNNLDLIKQSAKKHKFKVSGERSIFSGKRELKSIKKLIKLKLLNK